MRRRLLALHALHGQARARGEERRDGRQRLPLGAEGVGGRQDPRHGGVQGAAARERQRGLVPSHALQDDEPGPLYMPASHREHDEAPEKEKLPAAQSEQLDAPTEAKVPAKQSEQLV